jgi:hypothetical protein
MDMDIKDIPTVSVDRIELHAKWACPYTGCGKINENLLKATLSEEYYPVVYCAYCVRRSRLR